MLSFLFIFVTFFRTFRHAMLDPHFRALGVMTVIILAVGTVFYTLVEDWSVITSLYFCVITLLTIGYGDFTPTTDAARVFTIFYVFVGLGFVLTFVSTVFQKSRIWSIADEEAERRKREAETSEGV